MVRADNETHLQSAGKVAFIAHPPDIEIFRSYVRALRPDKSYSEKLLLKLFEWMSPYRIKSFRRLSLDGVRSVDAELYMVPFLPEMKTISVRRIVDKIDSALVMAKENGCAVAALGGYTSIVMQGIEEQFSNAHGLRITSGNTLTAAIIIRSIERIAERFGIDLPSARMAIIGASGDIGSGCTGYFCSRAGTVVLSARNPAMLMKTVERHRGEASAEMVVAAGNRDAIDGADICIFVTSAPGELFRIDDFGPGTVVCDASAPVNVSPRPLNRDDVFLYHGGITAVPFPLETEFDIGLASPYTFYGCQIEGMLLALYPDLRESWGRGNITPESMNRFFGIMDATPSLFPVYTCGNTVYSEDTIDAYAERWKDRSRRSFRNGEKRMQNGHISTGLTLLKTPQKGFT